MPSIFYKHIIYQWNVAGDDKTPSTHMLLDVIVCHIKSLWNNFHGRMQRWRQFDEGIGDGHCWCICSVDCFDEKVFGDDEKGACINEESYG